MRACLLVLGTNVGRGREGDEIEDILEEEHMTTSKPRRRSNSNSRQANGAPIKNKFEVNDIDEEAVEEQQPTEGASTSSDETQP
jgi:ribosome-interacting GTPase 1